MSVVEAKLDLLEMQLELVASHAMKLHQPILGIVPERLDAVDTRLEPLTNSLLP